MVKFELELNLHYDYIYRYIQNQRRNNVTDTEYLNTDSYAKVTLRANVNDCMLFIANRKFIFCELWKQLYFFFLFPNTSKKFNLTSFIKWDICDPLKKNEYCFCLWYPGLPKEKQRRIDIVGLGKILLLLLLACNLHLYLNKIVSFCGHHPFIIHSHVLRRNSMSGIYIENWRRNCSLITLCSDLGHLLS